MTAPPVLLLARPFDDAALKEAADRAGGAVLLTDGKKALSQSGPRAEIDRLATVIGKEVAGAAVIDPAGDWGAGVTPIAPGVWLWAFASSPSNTREADTSATTSKAIVWSAAALLSMVALFFGLRRAAAAPDQSGTAIGMPAARMTDPGSSAPVVPSATTGSTAYGATMHAAAAVPAPAGAAVTTFGRYTLLDRLGEGGMAQVFTAVTFGAEGFRRKFVIKRLRPELSTDQSVVAQFIDEANLASSLVHSNVIPVFDFGKVGDEYFLATEYILGRDLGRVVKRLQERDGHALPADIVLHCAHETLKALEYAHTKAGEAGAPLGIVHRDVSPNNVLVSARGEVKLFDFGIVKAEGRVTKTEHGVVKGNVSFMSPEQARGGNVDARADLFSLGLVMYYCLTGDVLYHGNTTYELLVKAATGPGADELPRIRALPSPAAAIVAKALSVDPNGRYQSAREFAATIAPHVGQASADLQALMTRLFADDFKSEEKLFASAAPTTDAGSALPASPGTGARRS
jgi:hypothetical protein